MANYFAQDFRSWKRCRRRPFSSIVPLFLLLLSIFALQITNVNASESNANREDNATKHKWRLADQNKSETDYRYNGFPDLVEPECIPAAINDFPEDFFTQEQRQMGGVAVHFAITMYLCAVLGLICDKYFVPSLELVSEILHVPTDVAGATFMAIGTSAPELFSSVIGSFVTEGDIGVGAIVGSAVFNVIGITGLAGLAVWKRDVPIDWYPITRDSVFYVLSIIALIVILVDNTVVWYEAVCLLVLFVLYVIVMVYNSKLEYFCEEKFEILKSKFQRKAVLMVDDSSSDGEKTSLLKSHRKSILDIEIGNSTELERKKKVVTFGDEKSPDFIFRYETFHSSTENSTDSDKTELEKDPVKEDDSIYVMPDSVLKVIFWILMWPALFLTNYTVPDCRKEKWRKYYLLTFAMSVAWIAGMTYISVWMVTIIGYTFDIPDSISGITILAVGTSVPEIISSILVVRNGLGNMAICNLIGSNVFNIVFCLGAPWLIKTTLMSATGQITINSAALSYMTITLLSTVVLLYITFILVKWKINRKIGFICLIMYVAFIFLACYYELELLAGVGLPTCI